MQNREQKTALQEWRANWALVLAASVGFSFFSIMLAAVGLFMGPLGQEFGWNKTVLSAGPSIATITTAILGPFFGMLVDRYGTRRLVLPGLIVTMVAICAFSTITGAPWQWYLLWFLFGFVAVSIKSTAWTAAVVGVFARSRGLALGLVLAGTAVASIIVPPLGNWLITAFGWRMAFVWLALGWGGVTFVLCFLFFFDIHDRKHESSEAASAQAAAQASLPGLTRREGLCDSALWRLAISNFLVMLLTMGLSIHLFPILTEAGISRTTAAWLLSLSGIAGILGKLATGVLLDRFRPNWIGGLTLGACALAFALLIDGIRSPAMIVFAMLVNGYAFGTKTQITGYMTANYAGMKSFGFLYGIMAALMALASGLGPFMAGYMYDRLGGYGPFLLIGTVGCAIGGLIMISLPPKREFKDEAEEEAALFA
jgi:predicted MFS family arabinose efflux permease